MVTHPAPPQTRTCAINAYGSSGKAFCYPQQCSRSLGTRLVSSESLSCVGLLHALPDGAFPPVGRLGLTSPPSTVLCAATTATSPSRGLRLSLAFPIPCLLPGVCGPPYGLVSWWKRHGSRQGLWSPGPLLRVCNKETGGSPKFPSYPSGHMPRSQTPVVSCALAIPRPGLLPSGQWKPSA